MPQLQSPCACNYWRPSALEPVLHNKRSHRKEKPTLHHEHQTPTCCKQRKPESSNEDSVSENNRISLEKVKATVSLKRGKKERQVWVPTSNSVLGNNQWQQPEHSLLPGSLCNHCLRTMSPPPRSPPWPHSTLPKQAEWGASPLQYRHHYKLISVITCLISIFFTGLQAPQG